MPKKNKINLPEAGQILRLLRGRPQSLRQLLKAFNLPAGARPGLKKVLHALLAKRQIEQQTGGLLAVRQSDAEPVSLVIGRVSQRQADYAFIVPEAPGQADMYVAAADLKDALPEDKVAARMLGCDFRGRPRGKVVRILERAHERLVGTFHAERPYGLIRPDGMEFLRDFYVPPEARKQAHDHDKVVARVLAWPTAVEQGRAEVIEVLGPPDRPGVDITVIVRKHGLPEKFSESALAQAQAVARQPGPQERAGRLDLRDRPVVTIDGEDARDFDDAVSCEDLPAGGWRLGVHIADVSHYLAEGSGLDLEARERGTSVYLPDRVLHMLPEPLSCGVCSLMPAQDRLAVSAFMDIAPDGTVGRTDFARSLIHSAARLTYNQAEEVLAGRVSAGNPAAAFAVELLRLQRAAAALRRQRVERGSLDFDLPEAKVILGPEGRVTSIERRRQLASHRLIEDCMVAANEAVARYLARMDMPTLYRIHDQPAGEKLEALKVLLEAYGYQLESGSPKQASKAFQRLLASWEGKPEAALLNMTLLRSMKLAVYGPKNIGHFGLGSRCYTHFTSPIRRYPDLIVHRMLCERLLGPVPARRLESLRERMPVWGEQLSLAERRAEKAEREAVKMKQVEFMQDKLGEAFDGTIISVHAFGFFVELEEHFVEGMVKISALEDDYYTFQERQRYLLGERYRREFRTGDRVRVQVVRVDPEAGQVDFKLLPEPDRPKPEFLRHVPRWSSSRKRKQR